MLRALIFLLLTGFGVAVSLAFAAPGDPCRIWTYPNPAFDILGHEALHCFTGRFH